MLDLPILYAFSVGMVATVNPCGWPLLPAYVAYQLRLGDESRSTFSRAAHGTFMGLIATLGFVTLFGSVGLVISAGGQVVKRFFPYWGLGVGIVIVLLGAYLLVNRRHIGLLAFSRIQGPKALRGVGGFFLFGIAYGLSSLSCSLPLFLVVVGSALAAQGFVSGVVQFTSFGLGMGTVLISLALSLVFFRAAVEQGMRFLIPHLERVGALALVAAGSYLVYYWALGTGSGLLFA